MCNTGVKEQTQSEWARLTGRSQPRFWCLLASAKKDTGQENIFARMFPYRVPRHGPEPAWPQKSASSVHFRRRVLGRRAQTVLSRRSWMQVLATTAVPEQGSGLMYFCLCSAINVAVGKWETPQLWAFMDSSTPMTRHTLNGTKRKQKQPFANECFLPLCSDWWLVGQFCAGLSTEPGWPAPLPACLPAWARNKSGR